jgi:hypothetical protein
MEKVKTKNFLQISWYRISRHKFSAFVSVLLAYLMAISLLYIIDEINPGYKISYKNLIPFWGNSHDLKYNFYSGESRSTYDKIGRTITRDTVVLGHFGVYDSIGLFDDGDTLENIGTSGGYENLMKVTSQKNSFSLVQDAVIRLQDDQLLKSINIVTPLFEERLHIFYRKDCFLGDSSVERRLSANTDPWILRHFYKQVKNIQIGKVGSCTRIIAGDVMDLIERQIRQDRAKKPFSISYHLKDDSLSTVINTILQYKSFKKLKKKGDPIDIMFYVGADPTDDIRSILDSNEYGLMSVSPSFLSLLNSEFNLNLQVADFQKKYDNAGPVSTVGTFTSLIASKDIGSDDVQRMLKKISDATPNIQKSFIQLRPPCTDSCYSGLTTNCHYVLPLAEFGFYKYFEDTSREAKIEKIKALIPFLIAIISFFFPILKSVSALNSVFTSWRINQEIDRILKTNNEELTDKVIKKLNQELADRYGDGELSESHYNALAKRIASHGHEPETHEEDTGNSQNENKILNKASEKGQGISVFLTQSYLPTDII